MTQRPGSSRRSSATPTPSTSQPNSSSDHTIAQLDQADQYIPGITDEPAWPTLRAHLLTLAAETGKHPLHHLLTVATGGDLGTAVDMAAVLDWHLTALAPTYPGPLPWLPGTPPTLHADRVWGPYLAKRSQLVIDLADQVQNHAFQGDAEPIWTPSGIHPSSALIGDIAVWPAMRTPRGDGGTAGNTGVLGRLMRDPFDGFAGLTLSRRQHGVAVPF
jgi:hypothetical protein